MSREAYKLSIAMAAYRGDVYIEEQLSSLFAQSILPDEIVICDDSSDHKTESVIHGMKKDAPCSIRYYHNDRQLNVTKNFEKAVTMCTGDVIFLCDQDDVWHPDKLEVFVNFFAKNPECGAAICNGTVVGQSLEPKGYSLWDMLWFTHEEQVKVSQGKAIEVFLKHVVASGNTLAFRSSYKPLILPFPNLHSCHDAWIALLIAAVSPFGLIDQELISYRIHGNNVIGIGKPSLLDQIRMAKKQLKDDLFKYAALLHHSAGERLKASDAMEAKPHSLLLLEEKVEHSQRRDELSASFLKRLPIIISEWRKGDYTKYSYGLKSIMQDLFLR